MARRFAVLFPIAVVGIACSTVPRPPPPLAQNREVEAFAKASAWPNAESTVVILAAAQFMAARQERDGYEYFQRLAREQPQRPILTSVEGMLQAGSAGQIPLLKRVAWVEEAIGKLDRGAEGEPVAGRLLRGLVFADLPDRFGKAKQAVADLEASLEKRDAFPADIDRGVFRALAKAWRTLGDQGKSAEMLRRSGYQSFEGPTVLANISVGADEGFRFTNPTLVREAEGIYVAEGFDFANIAFLITEAGVVAIDAGTTEESAREAMKALRQVSRAPVRYVILTHSHWDHLGGLAAVRESGTAVIARKNFGRELARMRSSQAPFSWFFGSRPVGLGLTVDRVVDKEESFQFGGLELRLIPVSGGETEDALLVHLPKHGLLFVGDVFMPYVGPPFLSEGSTDGYLEALALVRSIAPRKLIQRHPTLTRVFNIDAIAGLETALRSLSDRYLPDALHSRPLAEILHDNYLPSSLQDSPKAVVPYLIVRDHFLQRLHLQNAGYWQADGDGMHVLTRAEWAALLDQFADGSEHRFARIAEDLIARGDAPLALNVTELGLLRHPSSARLQSGRKQALAMLIDRFNPVDPFRFIIYSQWAGARLAPVDLPPAR